MDRRMTSYISVVFAWITLVLILTVVEVDSQNVPVVMVNTFLDNVIQTRYLTDLSDKLPDKSINQVFENFRDDPQAALSVWGVYLIGYCVCVAIGIILIIVMVLACFIFPCCRCCGRCGGKDPEIPDRRGTCCVCGCCVTLGVVVVGLLLGAIATYIMGDQINGQLNGPRGKSVLATASDGIDNLGQYVNGIGPAMEEAILPPYIDMSGSIVNILDQLPNNSVDLLNNVTGVMTTLIGLKSFAADLSSLQRNLMEADSLARDLNISASDLNNQIAGNLTANFTQIHTLLMSCNSILCNSTRSQVAKSASVRVDFSVVNLTEAIAAINYSISFGLGAEINRSIDQMTTISSSVSDSTSGQIADAKTKSNETRGTIKDFISSINSDLEKLNLTSYKSSISELQNSEMWLSYVVPGMKWGIIAAASVVILVTFLYVLGLIGGVALPHRKTRNKRCTDRSCASRCLIAGVAFTFIFFWLLTLVVMVFFVAGGMAHTEFCRHVANSDKTTDDGDKSVQVLYYFDGWVSSFIPFGNFDVQLFRAYRSCYHNDSIYNALQLNKTYNITSHINTDGINKALTDIKNQNVTVPQVNITSKQLTEILTTLDKAFGSSGLNFTYMFLKTSGSVTEPDLMSLSADLKNLSSSTETNLTNLAQFARGLDIYYQQNVGSIQNGSYLLRTYLEASQSIIGYASFGKSSANLETSQETINVNGTRIVDDYINRKMDDMSHVIGNYVTGTIYAVEEDVGKCRPMYDAVEEILSAVCDGLVNSINGFWFSLGWCIFFLLVGIFIAVNLATMLRYGVENTQGGSDVVRGGRIPDGKS